MARTKTDDPKARARIAAAAEQLFAARGYDGTAVRDIARKAGVNGAMIHYYFGSKAGLYRAILEGAALKVRALLVETSNRHSSTRDRLASFVDAYAAYVLSHPTLARILYREMLSGGKHIKQIAQQYAVTNYTILKDTISEGVRRGELRQIDAELAPISLMGMVVIFQFLRPIISVVFADTKYDDRLVRRIATHTIDLFLNGAVAPASRVKKSPAAPDEQKPTLKRRKGAIMKSGGFRKTILIGVLFLILLGLAATVKYFIGRAATDRQVLSGTIEADEIHIGSKVGGRIEAVLVKEGQEVKQGEPIIRFEHYDLDAKHADSVAAVAQAEANLEKNLRWSRPEEIAAAKAQAEAAWMNYELARNGPRKQEIDAARAERAAAEADYEVAKVTVARVSKLLSDGVQSRQDYDNAKSAYDRAAAQLEAARQKLDLLLAGTRQEEIDRADRLFKQASANRELVERGARKEDIDSARAQVERARAALRQIDTQLAELEVKAPADAIIEVLQLRPGDLINPGSPVATLVEVDRLWVRVYVPEPELGYMQLGKEVSATVDTFRGETFKGRIEEIASRGEFTPRNVQTRDERAHQVFGVRVRLDNSARKLRAGMAADVTIPK